MSLDDSDHEHIGWRVVEEGMLCNVECPDCGAANRIVVPWLELCAHINRQHVPRTTVDQDGVTYDGLYCRPCGPTRSLPMQIPWKEVKEAVFRGQAGGFVTR